MTTRVKGLKISQIPELSKVTGAEMIPYQYADTNGKISTATILGYIAENIDPSGPTGDVEKLKLDVAALNNKVTAVDTKATNADTKASTADTKATTADGKASTAQKDVDALAQTVENLGNRMDNLVAGSACEILSHASLLAKVKNGTLVMGAKYAISDYVCAYRMPIVDIEVEYDARDFKYIICTATSNNTLDINVLISRDPSKVAIIAAKYEIDPEKAAHTKGMTTKNPTGAILYLEDANHNSCWYDFKHIKFRRWAVKDIVPNIDVDTTGGTLVSPYRCTVTANSRPWTDDRMRIGFGDSLELSLIPAIFNGTWRCGGESTPRFPSLATNTGLAKPLTPFHQDYILNYIKPYQDTTTPNDKYLAWAPSMDETEFGMSYPMSRGNGISSKGQCNVIIDKNDYMDRYTFDLEGTDATETWQDNVPSAVYPDGLRVLFNTIGKDAKLPLSSTYLPNFVIAISKLGKDIKGSVIRNVHSDSCPTCNTILLRPIHLVGTNTFGAVSLANVDLDTVLPFYRNLIITTLLSRVKFGMLRDCYLNIRSVNVDFGLMERCVMFGYYQGSIFASFKDNLLFGVNSSVKLVGETNFRVADDGEYWYNVTSKDFNLSNILGPCLYADFASHNNSLTFKAVYNKGFRTNGNNQFFTCDCVKWGVVFPYSMPLGAYWGTLTQCAFNPNCFNTTAEIKYVGPIETPKPENAARARSFLGIEFLTYQGKTWSSAMDDLNESGTATTGYYPNRAFLYVGSDGKCKKGFANEMFEGGAARSVNLMSVLNEEEQKFAEELYEEQLREEMAKIYPPVVIPEIGETE